MIQRFHHDEHGYLQWLTTNPNGYVFNWFGGADPENNVVHHASCWHLHREADSGRRTIVTKLVSTDLDVLTAMVEQLTGGFWKRCDDLPPA